MQRLSIKDLSSGFVRLLKNKITDVEHIEQSGNAMAAQARLGGEREEGRERGEGMGEEKGGDGTRQGRGEGAGGEGGGE